MSIMAGYSEHTFYTTAKSFLINDIYKNKKLLIYFSILINPSDKGIQNANYKVDLEIAKLKRSL